LKVIFFRYPCDCEGPSDFIKNTLEEELKSLEKRQFNQGGHLNLQLILIPTPIILLSGEELKLLINV